MLHAGEQDLREKRLCSPKNVNCLSCEQTGNKATGSLHPHPDPKDHRFIAYCSPPGDRTTSCMFPRGFQKKPASLELECWSLRSCCMCRMSGRTAVPPVQPKSMRLERSWKTEELCFSQGKGWPTVPQTSPFHPQRGCRALPKGFLSKVCPFAQMPHPQQSKPNADGEVSALMGFFSGTHNPQCN